MDEVIVLPTVNPDVRLISLVDALRGEGFSRIVVVDDGSDGSSQGLFICLGTRGCTVVHHTANRGKGAAIKTGIMAARNLYPHSPAIITVDDDGQHDPADVASVARASEDDPAALILGCRDLKASSVPAKSRLGNAFSSTFFRLDTGVRCSDTQTGLRAIPNGMWTEALDTPGERYEYEMNLLTRVAKEGGPLACVPIATIYVDDNRASHFDPIRDSCRIYASFIRFATASMACAAVDLGLFATIVALAPLDTALSAAVATFVARMASGLINFGLNKRWSFRAGGQTHRQAMRYAALFLAQMSVSAGLVTLLSYAPIPLLASKVLVDSGLFVVSYFLQRNWVFNGSDGKRCEEALDAHGQMARQ
ncbi:MAG: bifunctional glycosyltransferase family 2/GtrA family protein [Atopobiaceae bacterium]|jgi:putative flippase GtrA|nr:bifunctional glycosyltransferase family 2/GtrA family protein [Atopobiaceae bacterium]MCH4180846.1 bifunctional glycosyltransferase family 2/GtrA family protein [Atopobiaceae bacterium]MCH4213481.1 bifunctional glycosyltransferase family 2/GtrA family protein [Atopobiaceae bacterium]MCH4230419.1 bifunctional glycosyltransferase family 2/GtrA family protein [Atopobiaceae bacterium]MCH4277150.1 bifunctional glycosyltransferase family 2/GtrA family protein [Atopobiaceae bacterium]